MVSADKCCSKNIEATEAKVKYSLIHKTALTQETFNIVCLEITLSAWSYLRSNNTLISQMFGVARVLKTSL